MAAQRRRFSFNKQRYLAYALPLVREMLLADANIRNSFEWQMLFCLVEIAKKKFGAEAAAQPEPATITPEDTLRGAGIGDRRQARYQRRMSMLLTGSRNEP